jgi:hypothetical protein
MWLKKILKNDEPFWFHRYSFSPFQEANRNEINTNHHDIIFTINRMKRPRIIKKEKNSSFAQRK